MILHIHLFATLKQKAQASVLVLELAQDCITVGELLEELKARKPYLGEAFKSVIVAVNQEFAFADQLISAGDAVAMFPPVSGG